MGFPFIATIFCLSGYTLYLYTNQNNYQALHCLYTIILILYNSSKLQSDQKFNHLNNISIPLPSDACTNQSQPKYEKKCEICKKSKPPRYYHCRRCNICIFQMDHHCEWLNCCVGQFNYKIYMQILANLLIIGFVCIFGLFDGQSWASVSKVIRLMLTLFLLWEAGRMALGCAENISRNQTLVETYKRVKGPPKPILVKLRQIFGCPIGISWLLPIYADSMLCNIWQDTLPISDQAKQNLKQYIYADQYIYGTDEEDQYEFHPQKQKNIAKKETNKND